MAWALVDTSVLYGAANRRDAEHERALQILRGIDRGSLPGAVVLEFVLAETMNGLVTNHGHETAVDFLGRVEENPRIRVVSIAAAAFAKAKSLFRRHRPLSLVDACLVAYARREELKYLYAFDDDFDRADGVQRLATTTNPFDPR